MKRKAILFQKVDSVEAKKVAKSLTTWLKKKGIETEDVSRSHGLISERQTKDAQIGIVIGGDGTFLRFIRRLQNKDFFPIVGVNLGTLGFITEIDRKDIFEAIDSVFSKRARVGLRPLLKLELWRQGKCFASDTVFNDAVITRALDSSMVPIEISIADRLLTKIRADGYVVSTPTGSTGYALSLGGPLIHPQVEAILLMPLAPHTLSSRPIIVQPSLLLRIQLGEFKGDASLVFDGQMSQLLKPGDEIRVRVSDTHLRLVQSLDKNWTEIVRNKLKLE